MNFNNTLEVEIVTKITRKCKKKRIKTTKDWATPLPPQKKTELCKYGKEIDYIFTSVIIHVFHEKL